MTDELLKRGFDHPCRQTCSGWQQGFDRGAAEKDKEIEELNTRLLKCLNDQLEGRMKHLNEKISMREQSEIITLQSEVESLAKETKTMNQQAKETLARLLEMPEDQLKRKFENHVEGDLGAMVAVSVPKTGKHWWEDDPGLVAASKVRSCLLGLENSIEAANNEISALRVLLEISSRENLALDKEIEELKAQLTEIKIWHEDLQFRFIGAAYHLDVEKENAKLKAAIQRRMKSDEVCALPFDEDLAEALDNS